MTRRAITDEPAMSDAIPEKTWSQRLDEIFGIDLRSLAMLRFCLGLIVLIEVVIRWGDLEGLYSSQGIMREGLMESFVGVQRFFCIHYYARNSVLAQGGVFVATGVAALALMVGFRTRIFTIITWYFTVSLMAFNPLVLHSGDATLRLTLFWSIFLPLGARWSWDARRRGPEPVDNAYRSVASAALLLQTCFIYWFTMILKYHPIWLNGEAVYYAMNIDLFATDLGIWLRGQTWLHAPLTYGTMIIEAFLPLLAFCPWRTGPIRCLVVFCFVCLHASFGLCLLLSTFAYISMIAWIPFIPGWLWDRRPGTRTPPAESDATPRRLREHPIVSAVCGLLLFYVFIINYRTTTLPGSSLLPRVVLAPAKLLRIHQRWAMFAPHPLILDGWALFHATLDDDTTVELFDPSRAATLAKPPLVIGLYPNMRWALVVLYFNNPNRWSGLHHVADALGRQLEATLNDPDRLVRTVDIYYVLEKTRAPGDPRSPMTRTTLLLSYDFVEHRTLKLADPSEVFPPEILADD